MNELRVKAISGAGWTFGSSVLVRLLQLLVTVVLARLLVPSDFGLFALAFMVINAVNVFRDYGFAQHLIYERENVRKSADATFWMSVAFGIIGTALVYLSSPFIARLFTRLTLIEPLQVMSLSVVISSTAMVPSALLEKEMQFQKRALPEVANGAVYAVTAIVLAYMGLGVWSLVTAHLAGVFTSCAAAWLIAGWRPGLTFAKENAYKSLSYGRHLMMGSVLVFAFFYIDHAAVGRFLGTTALGFYSLAFTICNLPATNITHVVNKVMFPTYTKLNHDRSAMANAYLQTISSIAVLSFPLALAFCVFAQDFVPVFFGSKWLPTVPLFRILAVYGLYRSIGATCGSVFMATGQPQWVLRMNFVQVLVAAALLYPVINAYGTIGVAALFTFAYVVGTTLSILKAMKILKLRPVHYVQALKGPFISSLMAVAIAHVVCVLISQKLPKVVMESAIAAVLYVWFIILLDKRTTEFAKEVFSTITGKTVKVRA